MKPITITVDSDGTCFTHEFPLIGKNIGAEYVLKCLTDNGHLLIVNTMRCDHEFIPNSLDPDITNIKGLFLTEALNWYKEHDIPIYGIGENPTQHSWTSSKKPYSVYDIDDINIGCPLLLIPELSPRPFVDWCEVAWILYKLKLLTLGQYQTCYTQINELFVIKYNYGWTENFKVKIDI